MYRPAKTNTSLLLSKGSRVAAIYLIAAGLIGLVWPFTGFGPHFPEFQTQSVATQIGTYARDGMINSAFLIAGVGLLFHQVWARRIALIVLAISTLYSANDFSWGLAHGQPSPGIRGIGFLVFGLWNGLWFYLIFRNKPKKEPTDVADNAH